MYNSTSTVRIIRVKISSCAYNYLLFTVAPFPSITPTVTCARLEEPTNGEIVGNPITQTWLVGEQLIFRCFFGYNLTGSKVVECLPNGTFSDTTPLCEGEVKYEQIRVLIPIISIYIKKTVG